MDSNRICGISKRELFLRRMEEGCLLLLLVSVFVVGWRKKGRGGDRGTVVGPGGAKLIGTEAVF